MPLATIVDADRATAVGDTRTRFPTREAVGLACALFPRERNPERVVTVDPLEKRDRVLALEVAGKVPPLYVERLLTEGPQWRVEVGPGVIAVHRSDPARAERTAQRMEDEREAKVAQLVANLEADPEYQQPEARVSVVQQWSAKSRALMIRRLAELDFEAAGFDSGQVGMVTLTYPGDWLAVAPGPDACRRHLAAFRRRWERKYGPLAAVWKREFQRRGAPHFHIGCLIPDDPDFIPWLSATWAAIVDHPDPVQRERGRVAGTGVDFEKGAASSDPRRFAMYFSKHGIFAAKDYQNEVPEEWRHEAGCVMQGCQGCSQEGVGRFWGYWRLDRAVGGVHVAPDVAQAVVRTARRWSLAGKPMTKVYRWRKVTTVDAETGELGWRWRRRRTTVPIRRLTRSAGYLVVNDGPSFAGELARYAGHVGARRQSRRSGAGPVGFLP